MGAALLADRPSRLTNLPLPAVLRAKVCDCTRELRLLQRQLRLSVAVADEQARLAAKKAEALAAGGQASV
jgi:hypothetical protein